MAADVTGYLVLVVVEIVQVGELELFLLGGTRTGPWCWLGLCRPPGDTGPAPLLLFLFSLLLPFFEKPQPAGSLYIGHYNETMTGSVRRVRKLKDAVSEANGRSSKNMRLPAAPWPAGRTV